MKAWRISQWVDLTGTGGVRSASRWNPKGVPAVYLSEHPALALLEVMAHMHLSFDDIPLSLKLIAIEIKPGAAVSPMLELPQGWQANEMTTQATGGAWLTGIAGLVLPVPSTIVAHATNFLINPRHPQARTHLEQASVEPFWIDHRFFQ